MLIDGRLIRVVVWVRSESFIIAMRPGPSFLHFYRIVFDKPIFESPFRGSIFVFIVADILDVEIVKVRRKIAQLDDIRRENRLDLRVD